MAQITTETLLHTNSDSTLFDELFGVKAFLSANIMFSNLSYTNIDVILLKWICPSCKQVIEMPNAMVDKVDQCPHCNEWLTFDWSKKKSSILTRCDKTEDQVIFRQHRRGGTITRVNPPTGRYA